MKTVGQCEALDLHFVFERIVLRTYGAGNVPSSRQDLLDALKEASERGVLIVNVTQCWRGGVKAIYTTGLILNEYGVTPGYVSYIYAVILINYLKYTHRRYSDLLKMKANQKIILTIMVFSII
ncbi:unnamed protein product [Trichobilharzia regenti]|nr:unnamed protein product [Trichobilharzia regenti]